jgi:hypothetical protein
MTEIGSEAADLSPDWVMAVNRPLGAESGQSAVGPIALTREFRFEIGQIFYEAIRRMIATTLPITCSSPS